MSENNKLTTYEKLRKSVIDYRASHTIEETAKSFNTSYRTVIRWVKQYNNDIVFLIQSGIFFINMTKISVNISL
jgi:Helix-turn-helix domain